MGSSYPRRVVEGEDLTELGDNLFRLGQHALRLFLDDLLDLLATG